MGISRLAAARATQSRHLGGPNTDQSIGVVEERLDGDHIHSSQSRVGAAKHLSAPEDAQEVASLARVQLEDDFGAHAGPDHDVELEDAEETRDRTVVCHIVTVDDGAGAVDGVAQVLSQLGKEDAVAGSAGGQRGRAVAVDEAVLVLTAAEDGFGIGLRDAVGRVANLTRQSLLMAEARREIVKVVVEPVVPGRVSSIDAADRVELVVQSCRLVEMERPVGDVAADAVAGEHGGRRRAAVCRLEAVNAVWLDESRHGLVAKLVVLALNDLTNRL